ncbi:hypothetical protein [Nonomuraea rubra]|uniref:hypothetical protein n=1 Tax=Nonomuraea rubra TaxID=46180 RepID=UPI00360EE069
MADVARVAGVAGARRLRSQSTTAPLVGSPPTTTVPAPSSDGSAVTPSASPAPGSGRTADGTITASAVPSESATSPGRRTPAAHAPTA